MRPTAIDFAPSRAERRTFQRVRVKIYGRFMLEDRTEHAGQVVDMSPGNVAFRSERSGRPGEKVIAYIDHIGRVEGVVTRTLPDGFAMAYRRTIMEIAGELRIPITSGWPAFAQAGALCTYGPRLPLIYRRVAHFVARILNGTRAADLPVERPSQFELVLNQATARSFNLAFSRAILARADEVIE